MRYISFFRPAGGMKGPSGPNEMAKMQALAEREKKAGRLLMTGAFLPASQGRRMRRVGGEVSVEDGAGPQVFAEGCGFAILQAKDAADQRAQIEEFLSIAGDGDCIIVPIMDGAMSE